jgi:hypothetical protein
MELPGKRLGTFSLRARRVFVGLALAPCIVTVANYYLGWGLFGRIGISNARPVQGCPQPCGA